MNTIEKIRFIKNLALYNNSNNLLLNKDIIHHEKMKVSQSLKNTIQAPINKVMMVLIQALIESP
jgi:hypothetical protein